MHLPPGAWSSQRHGHSHEFVYLLEGELVLVEDDGETLPRAGDCAAFPKASGNGHQLVNRSDRAARQCRWPFRAQGWHAAVADIAAVRRFRARNAARISATLPLRPAHRP
ncbi:MAG: cupin domain-containing protein [Sphingomonas sp.]|jgi:uncharacterized cupin superfamily protein|uniref:cupin domain-containing protein n=1 Tax=Sphingomonas sp. TaxID=28214 RepID=UPI0035622DB4